jgi:hypothetical protein
VDAREATVDQVAQERLPARLVLNSRKPSELTALATRSGTLRTSPAQVRFITIHRDKIRVFALDAPSALSLRSNFCHRVLQFFRISPYKATAEFDIFTR